MQREGKDMAGDRCGRAITRSDWWRLVAVSAALALPAFLPAEVEAAPGSLDPTFGIGGVVETDLGGDDYGGDVVTDSAGRVVVVGNSERNDQTEREPIVVRYTAAGMLDPTFGGGDGIVPLHFGTGAYDFASGVAIDAAGRILVSGAAASNPSCNADCHAAVTRLTDSGQLDPAFSSDGIAMIGTDFSRAEAVAVDGSGRIILGGNLAVYRFTESGVLDSSFGDSGAAPLSQGAVSGLAIDSTGRIVTASDFGVERLLDNGQVDSSFGVGGTVSPDIAPGSSDFVHSVALDDSDRVIVGGVAFLPDSEVNGQPFIVRYTLSGAPDSSFGDDGIVLGNDEGMITGLTVDPAGRYIAVGYSNELDLASNLLIRYLPDGSRDPAFGGGSGFVPVPFFPQQVITDPAQRIVVTGNGGNGIDFAIARYLEATDPTPPPAPIPLPPSSAGSSIVPPGPTTHPGCGLAQKRVAQLRHKLKQATDHKRRNRLRSQLRQARARVGRLC
jgi:uncharacterized delta-60 repeat protein